MAKFTTFQKPVIFGILCVFSSRFFLHRTTLMRLCMAGYGDGRLTSLRDALPAIAMRFIDEYFSLFAA